jgi:hypothetical protein
MPNNFAELTTMGYDLHATRAEFWAENDGKHITADEWLSLVGNDPELAIDEGNGPYFAVFTGSDPATVLWLDWAEGNVYTKNPNRATVEKLLAIADTLGAAVQGDDGENYEDSSGFPETFRTEQGTDGETFRIPPYERRQLLWKVVIYAAVIAAIVAINVFDLW